jgi:hypothetical protein
MNISFTKSYGFIYITSLSNTKMNIIDIITSLSNTNVNSRDIITIKGIIQRLLDVFENHHIMMDLKFTKKLERTLSKNEWVKLAIHINKIHKKVKKDLNKGFVLCEIAEAKIKKGRDPAKEMGKILPYINSFYQDLFGSNKDKKIKFGPKSENDYLLDLLYSLEKNSDSYVLIKQWIAASAQMTQGIGQTKINELFDKLKGKVIGQAKFKRGLISLNSPKLQETVEIDKLHKIHIEIFFDKDVRPGMVKELLEDALNIISQNMDQYPNRLKLRLEKRRKELEKITVSDLQKIWIEQLKKLVVEIFKNNKDLLLTPVIKYQIRIGPPKGGNAYCDSRSLIDNYLIGIEISLLITAYLLLDNFFESAPLDNLLALANTFTSNKTIIPKSVNIDSKDVLTARLSAIAKQARPYRTLSLFLILTHETEHAFDREYLFKQNKVITILNYILKKFAFYKYHKTANVGIELMELASFYFTCRQEATAQFREFIAKSEANKYHVVNPIPAVITDSFNKLLNEVLTEISNRPKELVSPGGYGYSGFGYMFGFMMALIIFLADCLKKNVKLIIVEDSGAVKLVKVFPKLARLFQGYSSLEKIKEGSPEWMFLQALGSGTDNRLLDILRRNKIHVERIQNVGKMLERNIPFYFFRPPMKIMLSTLKKIEKTDETTFFDLYEKSCNILGIKDRLMSPRGLNSFTENLFKAKQLLVKEAGFRK